MKIIRPVSLMLSVLILLPVVSVCGAQTPVFAQDDEERVVSAVEIQGNQTVATQTILSQIRATAGRPASAELLGEDLKRLYGMGYFRDVQIKQDIDASSNRVKIIFVLKEKPILKTVGIAGNQRIETKKIQEAIRSKVGAFFDEQMIRRDLDAVRKLYEEKGFYEARAEYKVDFDPAANQASLAIQVNEGTKLIIRRIDFEGARALKTGEIAKRVQTKTEAWWGLVSGTLKEDVLDIDVQRVRAYYDENGYSDAKISYRIDPLQRPGDVRIVFVIEEGRQYLVGNVSFDGNRVFTNDRILKAMSLKPNSPFSRQGLRQSVTNIQDLYFEKGYMNARVLFDSLYNAQSGKVDTSYKITENNVTLVNHVKIRGNTKTKDIVIRRELRVYPGEPFNGALLKRSKERLFNLGFFDEVQFDTEDTEDPDRKDLVVTVKETKTGEFSFGGGFSSIDKAMGFVQIRQRNFDHAKWPGFTGAGEDLTFRVQVGSVRSQGEISWTDPWFMGYPFSFGFDIYREQINRSRSAGHFFDETRTGGRLRFGKELTDFDRVDAYYNFEQIEIEGIPDDASADFRKEEGTNNLSRIGFVLSRDTRDNKYVPSQGHHLAFGGENVGGFVGGDKDFWRLTSSAAQYFPVLEEHVLEIQGRGGISEAFDDTENVPIYERFYAGGANTIRGYQERRIGPRDPGNQEPIGGNAYWVTNVEYTFPVVTNVLKGAAFYDVGNVYATIDDFGNGGAYSGLGMGVRIKTPIGPVKVDAGYPLDDVPGEKKQLRFYFNMSRGF